ncbi:hypothetical protein ACIF70_19425 [Actinacidiphila glaucinigra]|uniref:hypothetical protein n=1 Tax=Actinacidiphila glaucinigra TaxID=235986 RepID=UPI002DDA8AA4|nr:hypothetical protein [Actinacidiphila glaucinigra]WSD58288.1 hypothetical protein OIE69_04940 [Actinacidiphila glaucinigra]
MARRAPAACPRGSRRSARAVAGTLVATLFALLGLLVPAAATGAGHAPPPRAAAGDLGPGPHAAGPHAAGPRTAGPRTDCAAPARTWRDAPGERHSPTLDAAASSARTALPCPRYVTPRPAAAPAATASAHASLRRGRAPPSSTGI